jgi:hypothetical protein
MPYYYLSFLKQKRIKAGSLNPSVEDIIYLFLTIPMLYNTRNNKKTGDYMYKPPKSSYDSCNI